MESVLVSHTEICPQINNYYIHKPEKEKISMKHVVMVNEHMPWDGLSWGRTYTGGSGGGKAR
jgi:hypothetical protein